MVFTVVRALVQRACLHGAAMRLELQRSFQRFVADAAQQMKRELCYCDAWFVESGAVCVATVVLNNDGSSKVMDRKEVEAKKRNIYQSKQENEFNNS